MQRFDRQGDVIHDLATGLIWSCNASLSEFPLAWDEAFEFVKTLNQSEFGGFTDWKMPNRRELFSLLSHTTINPSLPAQHPFEGVFPGYYWTSTSCARLPDQAWYIHLGGARVFKGMKYNAYMVWPVRHVGGAVNPPFQTGQRQCFGMEGEIVNCTCTGQDGELQSGMPYPEERFEEENDTVFDRATGLTWMKKAGFKQKMIAWADAFDIIEQINRQALHGFADWRMPTIAELESLTDMDLYAPSLAHNHPFVSVQDFYWSATTSAYNTDYAWALYLRDGAIGVGYKPLSEFFLWPVRGCTTRNPFAK